MLAETAERSNPDDLEIHKPRLELWRLLKYNFDRASAFNVINIVEIIRSMQSATTIQDVLPKVTAWQGHTKNSTGRHWHPRTRSS